MTIKWLHILGQWRVSTRAWTISKMVTSSQAFSCFGTATDKAEALEESRYSILVPSSWLKKAEKWKLIVNLKISDKNWSLLLALPPPRPHQRCSPKSTRSLCWPTAQKRQQGRSPPSLPQIPSCELSQRLPFTLSSKRTTGLQHALQMDLW